MNPSDLFTARQVAVVVVVCWNGTTAEVADTCKLFLFKRVKKFISFCLVCAPQTQSCPKRSNNSFYLKMMFLTAKKSPNIWATFARKFVNQNILESPNLVTLCPTLFFFSFKNNNLTPQQMTETIFRVAYLAMLCWNKAFWLATFDQ